MVIEGLLATDRHRRHKSFFVKELCYPARMVMSSSVGVRSRIAPRSGSARGAPNPPPRRAFRRPPSGPDVHPQLYAPRPPEGSAAEKRALQEVLLVEHVLDVDLGSEDRPADGERVPGARVQNEAGRHLDRLVEVEETGSVGRVRVCTVGQAAAVRAGRGEVKSARREHNARNARKALVVVQVD